MDTLARIRQRQSEIAKSLDALTAEIKELVIAERVIARLEAQQPQVHRDDVKSVSVAQPRHIDLVIATLRTLHNRWAENWSELQTAIENLHGVQIPKSSLLPYLSNLKSAGVIVRNGARIALAERVMKGAGASSDNSFDPGAVSGSEEDNENDDETPANEPIRRYRYRIAAPQSDS